MSDITSKLETAVFGGGCFWCTEAIFKMLRGVSSVLPGYAGGTVENPTYGQVSNGKTGHVEVIKIEFDPAQIRFLDLLTVFFASHDPTTRPDAEVDGVAMRFGTVAQLSQKQGTIGTATSQYASVIFYTTDIQREEAEDFVKKVNVSNKTGEPVVTMIRPLSAFYEAEDYHRDYFATHPDNPYCELVINPKLEKVQQKFTELLKTLSS